MNRDKKRDWKIAQGNLSNHLRVRRTAPARPKLPTLGEPVYKEG